jgi:uncharacterized membrane protein YbhN (UPF0104 family)
VGWTAVEDRSVKDTPSAPVRRPLWRRLSKPVVVVVALVAVFGWLLPQFIDYRDVWEALSKLDAADVAVLLGLALARVLTEALIYRALLPGLGLGRGTAAYLSSNLAGQMLPPPSASVVQYGYFRGGGYAPGDSGLAAVGSFLFPTIGRFLLPFVALALMLVTGQVGGSIVLAGALSVVATAVSVAVGYLFLRRESSARWLGAKGQRPLSWLLLKLKRRPIEDGADSAARFRSSALAALHKGWALGSIGVASNLFLTYLILLAALRFVGVSASELSGVEAFAAFAVAFWAGAVFPITGSGLGVVDAVLIAALVDLSDASDDALVAAALLWRVFYSILPLPLGAITLSRFRKEAPAPTEPGF